ncbi:acyltransferase family protein [Prevotella sp. E9-3]|uniref:acyltransferase family protein n=1 Tax=Prevotella sp. E9-3 TaxID=2913621 RepID=UPI001EDC122F|nr:acyltransferase family protein [Prevotella sp. E9-3]UKK47608.1 acyltransferase family protein [Prevotella sp. E9-3]
MSESDLKIKKRPNFLDYSKVIGILLVVFGHYVYYMGIPFENNVLWNSEHIITLFHMPLFYVVSGILYKYSNFKETLNKVSRQLVLPYIFICLICLVIGVFLSFCYGHEERITFSFFRSYLLGIMSGGDFRNTSIAFSGAMWFCYSLAIIKILMSYLYMHHKFAKFCLFLSFLFLLMDNLLPFRFDSTMVGFLFFYIGFYFKNFFLRIEEYKHSNKIILCILGGVSFLVLLFCTNINIDFNSSRGLSINTMYFGHYPLLFIMSGISGTIFVMILSSLFVNYKSKVILGISNGTIIVLGFHKIFYIILKEYIETNSVWVALFISSFILSCCYVVAKICDRYFPLLTGYRR